MGNLTQLSELQAEVRALAWKAWKKNVLLVGLALAERCTEHRTGGTVVAIATARELARTTGLREAAVLRAIQHMIKLGHVGRLAGATSSVYELNLSRLREPVNAGDHSNVIPLKRGPSETSKAHFWQRRADLTEEEQDALDILREVHCRAVAGWLRRLGRLKSGVVYRPDPVINEERKVARWMLSQIQENRHVSIEQAAGALVRGYIDTDGSDPRSNAYREGLPLKWIHTRLTAGAERIPAAPRDLRDARSMVESALQNDAQEVIEAARRGASDVTQALEQARARAGGAR